MGIVRGATGTYHNRIIHEDLTFNINKGLMMGSRLSYFKPGKKISEIYTAKMRPPGAYRSLHPSSQKLLYQKLLDQLKDHRLRQLCRQICRLQYFLTGLSFLIVQLH